MSKSLILDNCREFPSLNSGTSQNANSQPTWGSSTQRSTHTPVQRPQQNANNPQGNTLAQSQPSQQQLHQEDLFPSSSQFANGLDDYRFGGQSAVGQGAGSSQPQTTNIEDFPPLGRTGNGEIGQDRRGGLMQNNAFGGQMNGNGFNQPFSQQTQGAPPRSNPFAIQQDGNRQGSAGGIASPVGMSSGGGFKDELCEN